MHHPGTFLSQEAQSSKDGNKHTYTGHPLPDFYLQNTCKFAVKSARVWHPSARGLPYSTQDILLHSQRLLQHCRICPCGGWAGEQWLEARWWARRAAWPSLPQRIGVRPGTAPCGHTGGGHAPPERGTGGAREASNLIAWYQAAVRPSLATASAGSGALSAPPEMA